MSFLGLVKNMAHIKFGSLAKGKQNMTRTPAPLGLHQGSAVNISATALLGNKTFGGIMPSVEGSQSVTVVGAMTVLGNKVFRSYLSDGLSFIETYADPKDPTKSLMTRLYTSRMEVTPGEEGWAELLAEADGRIGFETFDIYRSQDKPDAAEVVTFSRMWSNTGAQRVEPENANEQVIAADGSMANVEHRMMQYGRYIDQTSGCAEYLLAEACVVLADNPDHERATFNVFIGVDLDANMLTVFPS